MSAATWSFSALRTALAANLATISGLFTYPTIPGTIAVPCAIVEPDQPVVQYDNTAGRGSDTVYLRIILLIQSATSVDEAQKQLDAYIGSGVGTIKSAAESDQKLNGNASFVVVQSASNYGASYTYNATEYIGCEFAVRVMIS